MGYFLFAMSLFTQFEHRTKTFRYNPRVLTNLVELAKKSALNYSHIRISNINRPENNQNHQTKFSPRGPFCMIKHPPKLWRTVE